MLRELSLFSGYGGFSLGLRLAGLEVTTVGYVENEPYCQEIIKARIRDGYLDWAPIIRDIRTADFRPMAGLVDVITAGFPCQPHSVAGQRRGADDDRNLWPDTLRAIGEVGPRFVLLENVPGILASGYGGTVVGQLAQAGYDCIWDVVSAADVGAPHLRKRWWCLAVSRCRRWREDDQGGRASRRGRVSKSGEELADSNERPDQRGVAQPDKWSLAQSNGGEDVGRRRRGLPTPTGNPGRTTGGPPGRSPEVADDDNQRPPELCGVSTYAESPGRNEPGTGGWWAVEPPLGRVVDGAPNRVGQLRALGNGIVPAVVAEFLRRTCK